MLARASDDFSGFVLNIHLLQSNGDKFTQRVASLSPADATSTCFVIFATRLAGKRSQAQNMPFFSPKQGLQNRSQLISSALF